jgi:hypothetical protein
MSNEISIFKTFVGKAGISTQLWSIEIDEKIVRDHLIEKAGCLPEHRQDLSNFVTLSHLFKHLSSLPELSKSQTVLHRNLASIKQQNAVEAAIELLSPRLPKFVYFASYDRMSGNVSIDKLQADIAANALNTSDRVFLAFLDFAGTKLEELLSLTDFESLKARVEGASIKISKQIFEYWSQNRHLRVEFSITGAQPGDPPPFNTGTIMRTRIFNQLHEMTVGFDERSAGFVWFFSFLVWFSHIKKTHGNVIILLDEPGLNLHGTAQADLLRYIQERLAPNHQVVYTTHSPFMVPTQNILSVRTVEDVVREKGPKHFEFETLGTKVGDKILSTDRETLFPLQSALGYEITQSLFIGEHTLVVEGPSDILYIQAISNELKRRDRVPIDRRWTICPAGGVDKVSAFLSLFGGNKLHVAVFIDYAIGFKAKVEAIRKSKLLQDGHVFTAAELCDQVEADVEDVLGPELYAQIISGAFQLSPPLGVAELGGSDGKPVRLLDRVENIFRTLPKTAEFDHYSPAMWLLEHPDILHKSSLAVDLALNRFENLFKKLNDLLPQA